MSTPGTIRLSLLVALLMALPVHAHADAPEEGKAVKQDKREAREAKRRERKSKSKRGADKAASEAGEGASEAGEGADPAAAADAPAAEAPAGEASATAAPLSPQELRRRKGEARIFFKKGTELVGQQRYPEAIQAFMTAYELDPQPQHLYNLGVTHHFYSDELVGAGDVRGATEHREKAIDFYRQYLATKPRRDLVAQIQRYIDELSLQVKVAQQLMTAESARLEAEHELDSTRKALADAEAERDRARSELERERPASRGATERDVLTSAGASQGSGAGASKRMLGSTAMLAGGVILGAAAFYGLDARSASAELGGLGEGDQWLASYDWLHQRGEASERRMIVLSITGAAVLAGGAVVYFLGEREARAPRAGAAAIALTPTVGPTGAGVQVSGSF